MNDAVIITLLGVVVSLVAILTPVIRLNATIVKLNTMLDLFRQESEDNYKAMNKRVSTHGKEIDKLDKKVATHEVRITNLEGKGKKNG